MLQEWKFSDRGDRCSLPPNAIVLLLSNDRLAISEPNNPNGRSLQERRSQLNDEIFLLIAALELHCLLKIPDMSEPVQYVTNQQGERVGVLLDLNTYSRLANPLRLDEECLLGLSVDELKALASCKLAVADQTRLDDLVARNAGSLLCADEVAELDDLLAKSDQLTILKTRARYTLKCWEEGTTAA